VIEQRVTKTVKIKLRPGIYQEEIKKQFERRRVFGIRDKRNICSAQIQYAFMEFELSHCITAMQN
jgi:hypothetical protein